MCMLRSQVQQHLASEHTHFHARRNCQMALGMVVVVIMVTGERGSMQRDSSKRGVAQRTSKVEQGRGEQKCHKARGVMSTGPLIAG